MKIFRFTSSPKEGQLETLPPIVDSQKFNLAAWTYPQAAGREGAWLQLGLSLMVLCCKEVEKRDRKRRAERDHRVGAWTPECALVQPWAGTKKPRAALLCPHRKVCAGGARLQARVSPAQE